jgi:signal transduction histidine kinase
VNLARQQALSRPIEIILEEEPELPPVEHDPAQMQQVLLNLLLNALQAIDGAGRIRVQVLSHDNQALVSVTDTGRGIAPEHLASIFRPFFTTKGQGTGLGLSLARRVIEDHAGKIEVTSQAGQGTQFLIWLPFRHPGPSASAS